jgi:hypothetical protein
LKRYWFEFERNQIPDHLALGCGVTAYNYDDALYILCKKVFRDSVVPSPKIVIEDIDVSTLDAGPALVNMAPPNLRGISYPLSYS